MTMGTDCLMFCATSIAFTKYSHSFRHLTLFSFHFSCHTNQPKESSNYKIRFNVLSAVFCLLYTLPISNFVICSTRFHRVTSALELSKDSNPSHRQISVQILTRQCPRQYLCWVQVSIEWKVSEILNPFSEILFSLVDMYQWNSHYISLSPHHLDFIKGMWTLIVTLSKWYRDDLCQTF